MSGSERSDGYETSAEPDMSSEDAAELEQLRREAAALRVQLQEVAAAPGGARNARDVHQLEARIDSLASRNAKLMETLKEARQQLLAPARRGRPAGTAAQRLRRAAGGRRRRHRRCVHVGPQDAADLLTEHRQQDAEEGQTVRLNEALTVVEAGSFGIGRRDQHAARGPVRRPPGARGRSCRRERIVWLAEPLIAADDLPAEVLEALSEDDGRASCVRRFAARRHQGRLRVRTHPQGRGRGPGLEEVPTSLPTSVV